jgi:hypothetical protein
LTVESDSRFYARRAAEEFGRAERAITPPAQAHHKTLAKEFAARALKAAEAEEVAKLEC